MGMMSVPKLGNDEESESEAESETSRRVDLEALQGQIDQLRNEVANCHREAVALRTCLVDAGVLDLESYLSEMRGWKVAASWVAQPWVPTAELFDVLAKGRVSFLVGSFLGASGIKAIQASSLGMETVAQEMPQSRNKVDHGLLYLVGGQTDAPWYVRSIEYLALSTLAWERIPAMPGSHHPIAASILDDKLYVLGDPTIPHQDSPSRTHCGWNVGCYNVTTSGWNVVCYNITARCWEAVAPMLGRRWRPVFVPFSGRLYVCGGEASDSKESQSSVECFNPTTGVWSGQPSMKARIQSGCAAGMGDELYVICESQRHSECFSLPSRAWRVLPAMREGLSVNFVTGISNKLYVVGDRNNEAFIDCFCPSSGMWETLPPCLTPRSHTAAVAAGGLLYVFGGWDNNSETMNSVERYCPKLGKWEPLPPMSQERGGAVAASVAGRLYVCGGCDGDRTLRIAECFDPGLHTWTPLPSLSEARWGAAVATFAS